MTPEDDDEPDREPWYRRLGGGLRRGRSFWRRLRAANNGVRARYDQARSAQVRLAQVTALLAALGIGATFVLPSTGQIRAEVVTALTELDPRGFSTLDVTATTDTPTEPSVGFAVEYAVDGTSGRAWATPWSPPEDAGAPCRRPGGAAHLRLDLATASDVDRIAFAAGLPESSPDRATQDLPRTVDVRWGEAEDECQVFELAAEPGLQGFDLHAQDVESVTVVVVDVHEAQDPPAERHVAFSEVLLLQRGAPASAD